MKSKRKSKVNLNHVISVAKPCELTLGERGGQLMFRDCLFVTFENGPQAALG